MGTTCFCLDLGVDIGMSWLGLQLGCIKSLVNSNIWAMLMVTCLTMVSLTNLTNSHGIQNRLEHRYLAQISIHSLSKKLHSEKKWKTIRIIRQKSSWLLFWGYYHLMKILLSIFDRNSSMRKSTDKPILGIIIRSNKWCKIHQPN